MKYISHYLSLVVEYNDSDEMKNDIPERLEEGWEAVSISYGRLRVRYRKNFTF